ncbi:MAG: transporter [Candidatus Rokuibacteriota bacterium]|nr:MAG: transporter [Candidatus Rokubacteria bacterium]
MRRRRRRSTRGAPTFGVSWRASRRSAGTEGMEAYLRRTVVWYGGVGLLTSQVFRSLALPPKYFRLVVQEIEVMGVRSLGVALTAAIFTGMVFTIQSAVNMARFGAESYVGPIAALAILRELGPVLTAILVGGKVASGITAELGSMKVTEQIDALRTLGVNYIKRLVVPRVLAALIVFPLLTVLADAVGVLGGMLIMYLERGADVYAYWNITTYWVVPKDFLTGVGKSVFFGIIVTLIGCYNGLSTEGGTEGLGRATTSTVVHVTMGVIVSDFFITKLFLTLFY